MNVTCQPARLDLQKDFQLVIEWQGGGRSIFPIEYLRDHCPCAKCKQDRAERQERKGRLSLKVLSADQSGPLTAIGAELVGNYALRIEWSDRHGSGIYSFEYLRSIDPAGGVDVR